MNVNGQAFNSIWYDDLDKKVKIIDQRWLPHEFRIVELADRTATAVAIREMWVRGAPLIGATAAYGVALQMRHDPSDQSLDDTWQYLHSTRPTAINLRWALDAMRELLLPLPPNQRADAAFKQAAALCTEDIEINRKIGLHGLQLIKAIAADKEPGEAVNILTHCNAGWLATVDWGTATSPIYHAVAKGVSVHVWVGETRPRNQGAHLTAWELQSHGIDHHLIVDNASGHLMQHGQIDMVIVGSDRTTASGDVCNKIGTYHKALAARDNHIPFYVALPSPTIDWRVSDGITEIPIEERDSREVTHLWGRDENQHVHQVQVSPDGTPASNPAFDVTPARLVTGLITERGVCGASAEALASLFPEFAGELTEVD